MLNYKLFSFTKEFLILEMYAEIICIYWYCMNLYGPIIFPTILMKKYR